MRQRSLMSMFFLLLFTFGIYYIVYMVKTNNFFKQQSYSVRPSWWFYSSALAVFAGLIGLFLVSVATSGSSGGSAASLLLGIIWFISIFATIILYYLAYWRYLNAAKNWTGGAVEPVIHVVLLFVFPLASPLLLQHEYNKKLSGGEAVPSQNPQPQSQQPTAQPGVIQPNPEQAAPAPAPQTAETPGQPTPTVEPETSPQTQPETASSPENVPTPPQPQPGQVTQAPASQPENPNPDNNQQNPPAVS